MAKKKELDKLSQDVAAAHAAHMSYGRWKAAQPPSKEKAPEGLKACKRCGKLFKPGTTQVYCNDECQYLARLDAKRKKD